MRHLTLCVIAAATFALHGGVVGWTACFAVLGVASLETFSEKAAVCGPSPSDKEE